MTLPNPHRRDEILDAAERRFITQGYLATSVAEVIADTGIAKGTFYHYFASKEAVMGAVIDRIVTHLREQADAVAGRRDLPALERLFALFGGLDPRPGQDDITAELVRDGNELMRMRALNESVKAMTPPLARVLADGCTEGVLSMADPEATAAALLTVTGHLIDHDMLGWQQTGNLTRLTGLVTAAEQLLGAAPGTLAPLMTAVRSEP